MKSTLALLLLAAGLVISTGTAKAQSDSAATADNNTHSDVRTVTGCLQKGDGATEYAPTGQDGSTWGAEE